MTRKYHRRNEQFNPVISRGIGAVCLLVLSIVITLSFFDKAGTMGEIIDEWILSFLFGSIRYAVPAVVLILAGFLIKDMGYDYRRTHGAGAILFFVAMSSLMHIKYETDDMWRMALEGHGGGFFGLLAWPIREYLGVLAGTVIFVGLVAVSIFLIFNTSLTKLVMINQKLLAGFGLLGRGIISLFSVFLRRSNGVKISGGYETVSPEDEEEKEDGRESESKTEDDEPRAFFRKKMPREDEDGEAEEESRSVPERGSSPWDKKVVVKNLPPISLLNNKRSKPTSGDIEANAEIIHNTLFEFGIEVDMGEVRVGPTVTQYSLKPAKGVKLSRITALSNDLALALAAHPIRIEAPIPGKSLVGIEVPNYKAALVTLRELLDDQEFTKRNHNLMIALGKDVAGKVWFADLPRMPHLLVAGATGSGKTVCINGIIMSLLYQNTAETLRFIMVDPKRVELTLYNGIPHLLAPVITNVQKTVNALKWTIGEMDRRFDVLSQSGCRDIQSYNNRFPDSKLPHIVFIIDELADLMAAAASEVEAGIIRLAQMARAVGIHLIVATQRPSVDVITGLMKANIPARIAFSVASLIDSRTILDMPGAEKLLGRGDMLFLTAELGRPKRLQGAFVSEEDVKNVVDYLKGDEDPEYDESIVEKTSGTVNMFGGPSDEHDPLFEDAKKAVLEAGKASASFLQRRLKLGYARAARILDEMEAAGIIGPSDGAKPRDILVTGADIEEESMDMGGELNVFSSPLPVKEEEEGEFEEEKEDSENGDEEIVGAVEELREEEK
ncbi:MAG TPA: DNA translocase FtsK [Patescibacteria group bacterium]|nr:DNA translocase FtsK [Patescibacteria group bacterium]